MKAITLARLQLAILGVLVPAGLTLAVSIVDRPRPVEQAKVHDVKPELAQDGSWALDFRFKNPRIVSYQEPGRGPRAVCYLWYQVTNQTDQARTFIPEFSLVAGKEPPQRDTILFKALDAIIRTEDPTGQAGISDSIAISRQPLVSSKGKAIAQTATGVATWDGDPNTKEFTVFITGLSSKWASNGNGVLRQTLQLRFKRQGKEFVLVPPAKWIMRPAGK